MARTVLIIDDSASVRSILKLFLMPLKVEVAEAESGARALQLLRLLSVDLVLADVNMAPMDGLQFLREVRASDRARVRTLPVILMTGDENEGLRERGMEAGANAFILKPIDPRALIRCMTPMLNPEVAPVAHP